ncbi:hypothetical protein N7510_009983 [Penicillium lagena]|uniref:uncharacterized protein n=1 Tax=Penicillium lagena TaxID=94218 RepID=UPI00254110A0|nr:uncharacterized protein N7510_009983 [Penicillium lagena]KAJ5604829.1 hypothetical protein N7510_009983 [Penicillium lagena]
MPGKLKYNPDTDIPDLTGKSIFITGGTGGLGAESALHLAKHNPSHIYLSGRNAKNGEKIIQAIKDSGSTTSVSFVSCDLSSLRDVKEASEKFLATTPRLDILICNAGIMALAPGRTVDGYEVQFGTNHLGHALLIRKLLPLLETTALESGGDARIVLLTSEGHALHPGKGIDFESVRTEQEFAFGGPWRRYGQSKLANLLYARQLAGRYPGITSVSVHPGVVATGLTGNLALKDKLLVHATTLLAPWMVLGLQEGAYNQVWAATAEKGSIVNGEYYLPVGKNAQKRLGGKARDEKLAERLWDWTEEVLKAF